MILLEREKVDFLHSQMNR